MTLIAVYKDDKNIGRCDARCYNAKGDECKCVCNGTNHGRGYDEARANTDANGDKLARDYEAQNSGTTVKVN